MISKELAYNSLIFLSIISFGFFGSLSHIFNLAILILLGAHFITNKNKPYFKTSSKKLFLALSCIFFAFLLRGLFHSDPWSSLDALSPMFPLPIIALMLLFGSEDRFQIDAAHVELFSKISVFLAFMLYFSLLCGIGSRYGLEEYFIGRLELFSGNPIPFSVTMLGVTIFCFADWKNATNSRKFSIIICFVLGMSLAGLLSGTRGTSMAIMLAAPVFLLFITRSFYLSLFIFLFMILTLWLLHISGAGLISAVYLDRIQEGIKTLFTDNKTDTSARLRLEMWSASLNTIKENPLLGYDISNRFLALKDNLPNSIKKNYSHPHNDIFASTIGTGIFGGILAIVSLLSPLWASLLSKNGRETKLFLGCTISISLFATANVNTIYFNDITSAWLAFSTFLIWNLKLKEKETVDVIRK